MNKFIILTLSLLIFTNISFAETINSYDRYGRRTGSYKTNGNTTIHYNKYGQKTGSFKTDYSGRTTQYDKYGRKVGSFK